MQGRGPVDGRNCGKRNPTPTQTELNTDKHRWLGRSIANNSSVTHGGTSSRYVCCTTLLVAIHHHIDNNHYAEGSQSISSHLSMSPLCNNGYSDIYKHGVVCLLCIATVASAPKTIASTMRFKRNEGGAYCGVNEVSAAVSSVHKRREVSSTRSDVAMPPSRIISQLIMLFHCNAHT